MKNTENQKDEKIIQFERKKRQKETSEKRTKKRLSLKQFFAIIIAFVIIGIVLITLLCRIKTIKVEGTQYYSDKEIVSAVKEDFYIPNSVFLKLRNKIKPIETMPFVENIDIRITGLNSITIRVNENLRAGCISYAGKYVYFDKDGYALEVMNKRLKDVPLVTGLSYDNITIYEKLPVKKKGYFSKIIRITTLITTNELTINEIQFKEDGDIVLKKADLNVNLGTGDDLDAQLSVLPGIFESLEGKSGTVYMDQYTKESKIITFRTKK